MEEQKYFIPEISNLFIGYECERYSGQGSHIKTTPYDETFWKSYVITEDDFYSDREGNSEIIDIFQDLKENRLRVLYLTKEQIENEGWSFIQQIGNTLFFKKKDFELTFNDNYININNFGEYDLGYWGQCKDINTFRYICKLLEI